MNNVIRLLPDSVANQIAAGEVIQRPASVIKELVENSVDAGATDIRIFIKDAGRTLIQVIDNGRGMTEMDARMAFERHATSKISAAADLFTLQTMGFRGEALPSICAISQVELRTRTADDELGTRLEINCSKIESQEPCVCDVGTNIMVRNIFCHLPARRRFLKSDSVELGNIMREFERLALVNNHIAMQINTGTKTVTLPKATLKQRIADIWKNNLNMQLIPIDCDTSVVKITGYISRPEFARRRNPLQYLIVNGRNMRHPYFHKGVMLCYQPLIAGDMQPCYFLKFEVDPATIDVNIHPTKNEIKFENEQEIWHILTAAIRAALGKFGAVPSIDFTVDALPGGVSDNPDVMPAEIKTASPVAGTASWMRQWTSHAPASGGGAFKPAYPDKPKPASDWGHLYNSFMHDVSETARRLNSETASQQKIFSADETGAAPRRCLQYALKYIVTTTDEGIAIIDQHRAHVRVLYERYMAHADRNERATQHIMFPEMLTLDPSAHLTLEGIRDEIGRLGFLLSHVDGYVWRIDGVPPSPANIDAKDIILRILDSICDDSANYGNEGDPAQSMLERVALIMARSAAITRGKTLTESEMQELVADLLKCDTPKFTPNGNPVMTIIDESRLEALL